MPYSSLPPHAFWKLCRDDPGFRLDDVYSPKARIGSDDRIVTAGSCFAQSISRYLARSNLSLLDVEPAPSAMPEEVARQFGFGLYSARYGNIYTARQLLQLVRDTVAGQVHDAAIWERDGRYYDALRPGVEPEGLSSSEEVRAHREDHLARVAGLLRQMDVLIFTLGLTEAWEDRETGLVFPSAPGVIAGSHDPDRHRFVNYSFGEVMADMEEALDLLCEAAPNLRVILTVSPVPLTATAAGGHVLSATTYSKSVLRAVAGELAYRREEVDYFPAYEIVAGLPFGPANFEPNLRSVSHAAVERVMRIFFAAHGLALGGEDAPTPQPDDEDASPDGSEICEEAMLEAFAKP